MLDKQGYGIITIIKKAISKTTKWKLLISLDQP